jgi:hypothetical protein
LGDVGVQFICEDIAYNNRMTNLKLTKNKITDEGVQHLCNSLIDN